VRQSLFPGLQDVVLQVNFWQLLNPGCFRHGAAGADRLATQSGDPFSHFIRGGPQGVIQFVQVSMQAQKTGPARSSGRF
jgi:hypothetical protein